MVDQSVVVAAEADQSIVIVIAATGSVVIAATGAVVIALMPGADLSVVIDHALQVRAAAATATGVSTKP